MPAKVEGPSGGPSLGDLIEEFRALELRRRQGGLPLAEAERYYSLFQRLDDALASGERHRKADQRQFLRVPTDLTLTIRTPGGTLDVQCSDFGGGGCFFKGAPPFAAGETVWFDGASLHGQSFPLHGRAVIAWVEGATGLIEGQGVRFVLECTEFRDQIDRLFYRVLDTLLGDIATTSRRAARSTTPAPEVGLQP
jgi:hypothetical protein